MSDEKVKKKIPCRHDVTQIYVEKYFDDKNVKQKWFWFVKRMSAIWKSKMTRKKSRLNIKLNLLTPKNMFLLESKPAAYILAFVASVRSTKIRQANLDIVLCITFVSFLSPGRVSITTKSIGDSDDRPT